MGEPDNGEQHRMDSMDDLDLPEETPPETQEGKPTRPRRRRTGIPGEFWDALSLLLLFSAALWFAVTLLIFSNPYTPLNPYPPETPIPTIYIPTSTPIPSETFQLPNTWTPTVTETPTPTHTPLPSTPTITFTPTLTGTPGPATPTPPASAYPYQLRAQPNYLEGSIIPSHDGCKTWVAGQAFDMKGSPVIGITVQIGGTLNQKTLYLLSLTGTALEYGTGGYEFVLAENTIRSKDTVWVQLLDQELKPLSDRIFFSTVDACDKNLILVNFKQVK